MSSLCSSLELTLPHTNPSSQLEPTKINQDVFNFDNFRDAFSLTTAAGNTDLMQYHEWGKGYILATRPKRGGGGEGGEGGGGNFFTDLMNKAAGVKGREVVGKKGGGIPFTEQEVSRVQEERSGVLHCAITRRARAHARTHLFPPWHYFVRSLQVQDAFARWEAENSKGAGGENIVAEAIGGFIRDNLS